jgi:DNA processing protein
LGLFEHSQHGTTKPLSPQERLAWLRLSRSDNIGPVTFYQLLSRYGSAQKALDMLPELAKRGGRKKPLLAFSRSRAEDEMAKIDRAGGTLLTPLDPCYPHNLKETKDAPPVITVLGRTDLLNKKMVAIVGARNASINGQKLTRKLVAGLVAEGVVIISGLARGIDTAAHEASLKTGTIAAVAGGADVIYPLENTKLYQDIIENGTLIAESPWGTEPLARHFPRRNRIISGASLGTLVVEATRRSGSLITARYAAEQGRDVFAVPGFPSDPRGQGPNSLLRDGAILVERAEDILDTLNNFKAIDNAGFTEGFAETQLELKADEAPNSQKKPTETSPNQHENIHNHLVTNLSHMPVTVDELLRTCQFNISEVQTILLEMELGGRILRHSGNRISLLE